MNAAQLYLQQDVCSGCHLVLKEPFIECQECPGTVLVCLDCFSHGREFAIHENCHAYKVIQAHLNILDPDWSAEEEESLLNAVLERGYGNWASVAQLLPNKSPEECKKHFERIYVENETGLMCDDWENKVPVPNCGRNPINYAWPLDDPPRPDLLVQNSKDLAGYNPGRGDFDHEHDSLAERGISDVNFDCMATALFLKVNERGCDKFESSTKGNDLTDAEDEARLNCFLHLASVEIYQSKLKKRARMKKVVQEFGLLNKSKTISRFNLYKPHLPAGKTMTDVFKLGQLMCSYDFDYLLESLQHETDLKERILRLQEYRENGLSKLLSTALFTKLKLEREQRIRQLTKDTIQDWLQSCVTVNYVKDKHSGTLIPTSKRRTLPPMDIVGFPGYEKLSLDERKLCSEIRVYPEVFLEVKENFISECSSNNGLRLADARPLVKIDVNKTRKLYDFLIAKGVIHKPLNG